MMALDVNGTHALTASFDYSVGYWPLSAPEPTWLEGHRAAVNSVIFIDDTTAASGGDDFSVLLWDLGLGTSQRLEGHKGKIQGLAAHGQMLASASWDGSIGIWNITNASLIRWLTGHDSNVNDVAFSADGATLYSASSDGTIRQWDMATGDSRALVRHGFGINQVLVDNAAGWLAYGALDGGTRILDLDTGAELADLTAGRRPVLALARRPDGGQIAVGDGEGYIMIVDTTTWRLVHDFRAAVRGPVWALDYTQDGTRLFAAGIDDEAFAWPLDGADPATRIGTGERSFLKKPETMSNGERQFARKCSICHTLTPDTARRAGPSLHGLFGRRAGTLPGYAYSDALRGADLIWNDDTIDKLFDIGPDHYTPGSKMPMQRIAKAQDRRDLIDYLRSATQGTD